MNPELFTGLSYTMDISGPIEGFITLKSLRLQSTEYLRSTKGNGLIGGVRSLRSSMLFSIENISLDKYFSYQNSPLKSSSMQSKMFMSSSRRSGCCSTHPGTSAVVIICGEHKPSPLAAMNNQIQPHCKNPEYH